jgi:hypothetical protein
MGANINTLIKGIVENNFQRMEIPGDSWMILADTINNSKYLKNNGRAGLADFLLHILKKEILQNIIPL